MVKLNVTISVVMAIILFGSVNIMANELDVKENVRQNITITKHYQIIKFGSNEKVYEVPPWEIKKIKKFNSGYLKILGNKSKIRWLRDLSGPSSTNKFIDTKKGKFVLINSCNQNKCDSDYIYILFDPQSATDYALLIEGGDTVWLGSPDDELKKILLEIKENN